MALSPGTRIGPYEILGLLGAGGMGEVYRARDPRLDRNVAIKVVTGLGDRDPDRLRRFELEAKTAGTLNHPNIVAVYDVGLHEGEPYLVTELLEGEPLSARLARSRPTVAKVMAYAVQIAAGLGAAHRRGVVHRDLKPGNLFVTKDGRVKILDFGLAKLTHRRETGDPSLASASTSITAGLIVGTAAYMSPEQIRGDAVDQRSDLFAFGAVLYEMLVGHPPFRRASLIETMNATLSEEPPPLPEAIGAPARVDLVIQRCLQKDPDDRFQSARDLEFHLATLSSAATLETRPRPVAARRAALRTVASVCLVLLGAGLIAGTFLFGRSSAPNRIPAYHQLTFQRGWVQSARFAPDGRTVIYSAAWVGPSFQLFSTRVETPGSLPLELPNADILAIAADGEMAISLGDGYVGTLARVPLSGGGPREVLVDVEDADWDPAGRDLAVARVVDRRYRLEYPIGNVLYETDGWISHPRVSPDGRRVAFLDHPVGGDDTGAVAVVGPGTETTTLTPNWVSATGLAWAPHGDEIWFTAAPAGANAALHAVDLAGQLRLVLRTPGRLVIHDFDPNGRVLLTDGRHRTVTMYRGPGDERERDLSWLGASSATDLSADGRTVLFVEEGLAERAGSYAIYLRRTDGAPAVRLGEGRTAELSPDGRWVSSIIVDPPHILLFSTGTGAPVGLDPGGLSSFSTAAWFPDGRRLVIAGNEPGRPTRLFVQTLDGGAPTPISPEGFTLVRNSNAVSPDGRYVAAVDGDNAVVIYGIDDGTVAPLALAPGERPAQWSVDGRSLFVFQSNDLPSRLYRVDVEAGERTLVAELSPADATGVRSLRTVQVSPDGRAYAYSYSSYVSDLHLVENLH